MKTRRILMLLALCVALLAAVVIVATCRSEEPPGKLRPGSGSWLPFVHRDLVGVSCFTLIEQGQWSYDSKKIFFQRNETLSAAWLIIGAAPFLGSGGGGEQKTTEKKEVMVYDVTDGSLMVLVEGSLSYLVPGKPLVAYRPFHLMNWETRAPLDFGLPMCSEPMPSPNGKFVMFRSTGRILYLVSLDNEFAPVNLSAKMDAILQGTKYTRHYARWGADGALYLYVEPVHDTYRLNVDDLSFMRIEGTPREYLRDIYLRSGDVVKSPDGKYGFRMDRAVRNYTRGKSKAGPIEVDTKIENLTLIGPDGTEKRITDNKIPDQMAPKK